MTQIISLRNYKSAQDVYFNFSYEDADQSAIYTVNYLFPSHVYYLNKREIENQAASKRIQDKQKLLEFFEKEGTPHDHEGAAIIWRLQREKIDGECSRVTEIHSHYKYGVLQCVNSFSSNQKTNNQLILPIEERFFGLRHELNLSRICRKDGDAVTSAFDANGNELHVDALKRLNRQQAKSQVKRYLVTA